MKVVHNDTNTKRNLIIIAIVAVVVVACSIFIISSKGNAESQSAGNNKESQPQSVFAFDTNSAEGWRQGPTNGTSLALFSNNRECFVSVEQKNDGTIDLESRLEKTQADLEKDGYTRQTNGEVTATMMIDGASQSYTLHKYEVSGDGGAGKLYGGQEFGYIQLVDSYVAVQGYCDEVEQLPDTLPALQSISYKSRQ